MKIYALILFILLNLIAAFCADAQIYKDAVGIRLGPTTPAIQNGITYKHFLNESTALEGLLTFGDHTGIAGLYEIHQPLPVENLQWLIGGGGYLAFGKSTVDPVKQTPVQGSTLFGGAGIIGLDYKLANMPINVSLDWKPELNIVPRLYFEGATVGVSARFTF